ncbi:MAG: hypothetical protein ACJ764_13260 [Solirubrobacteraceae bacterium]
MSIAEVLTVSDLRAPADAVWSRIASLDGINYELGPWFKMTSPAGIELSPEAVPLGQRWFRSWILFLGVIPFDYDDLCIEALEPGHRFLERSTMLSASTWEHERTLEWLADGGTRIRDRVNFEPRIRLIAPIHRTIIAATFRHRHRRLRRYFRR